MHRLITKGPKESDVAVIEIRGNVNRSGFDSRAEQLLAGSFDDAELSYGDITKYSLTFTKTIYTQPTKDFVKSLKGKHRVILAVGAEAMKFLCNTKRTLDTYVGSMTWNEDIETWVLPSYHPSVVYVGPPETLNSRYDKFDILYEHILRIGKLINGIMSWPEKEHYTSPQVFVGHDGIQQENKSWSGYWEPTKEELSQAKEIFTNWLDILDRCNNASPGWKTYTFALDTESRNLNVFKERAFLMLQIFDGDKAYAFNAGILKHPFVKPVVILFLNHIKARWIIHNLKYDQQVIWHEFGIDIGDRAVCTLALALGTTEKARQTSLKYQSRQRLNAPFYEETLEEWLDKNDVDYSRIPPHTLAKYGCFDVYYTYQLLPLLSKDVEKEGTKHLVRNLLIPAQRTFADVEYQGFYADVEYAKRTSAEWEPKIENAIRKVQDYARDVGFPLADSGIGRGYKELCECVPEDTGRRYLEGARVLSYAKLLREAKIDLPSCECCDNKRYVSRLDVTLNVNSPQQMQHLCYDILKMKALPYDDKRTTSKEFWNFNANHPLAKLVAEYKELQFLRRNFLEGIQRFVAEDGKVHPNFNLFGTKTGRLSVQDPAAQTFPAHSENGKHVKRVIVADPGCLIVNADYKSLEMFMAHHLTGDPKLLENLTGEWDIHTALAAVVYNKIPENITPEERQSVKSVNFGAGYGISGFKLALDPAMETATGGDPDVAQQFVDSFWKMYSVWAEKCDIWREKAHEEFYLTTEMGRKRRWNLITLDNRNKVSNQAINFPGQSMASDLCLSSLIRLHKKLQDNGWGRVILTVHDSLVFNIKKEWVHQAVDLIIKEMTTPPFETTTPFSVDVEVGINYGDKEPYDPNREYNNQ